MNHEDTLRRLAMNDPAFVCDILGGEHSDIRTSPLDPRSRAFARLGALVAVGATASSFRAEADDALAAGASIEEIVDILVAVAPAIGIARVVVAAPSLALAVGLDVDAELEELDDP